MAVTHKSLTASWISAVLITAPGFRIREPTATTTLSVFWAVPSAGAWSVLRILFGNDDRLDVSPATERWRVERPQNFARKRYPLHVLAATGRWRVECPQNSAQKRRPSRCILGVWSVLRILLANDDFRSVFLCGTVRWRVKQSWLATQDVRCGNDIGPPKIMALELSSGLTVCVLKQVCPTCNNLQKEPLLRFWVVICTSMYSRQVGALRWPEQFTATTYNR